MNTLYSKASEIITKSGGVTSSETLRRKFPIFIYSALLGQEEINLRNFKNNELVFLLENTRDQELENQILVHLKSKSNMDNHRKQVNRYLNLIENNVISETLVKILMSTG